MTIVPFLKRFLVRGVFWRQLLAWAVVNIPYWYEPIIILGWTLAFYVAAVPARRAVVRNLKAILPHTTLPGRYIRAFAVFWNFAWTITETARFRLQRGLVDWEFEGERNFLRLVENERGSIILTAHMGNYDLGAFLFAEKMKRPLTIVRAPESDPDTQRFENEARERLDAEFFRVDYNTEPELLILQLVEFLRQGRIVAIQGDRATRGVSSLQTTLFSVPLRLPSGPFALAMMAGAEIHPLFVVRTGRRRYRLVAFEPILCTRTGRDREADIRRGLDEWRSALEAVIRQYWYQWFMFEPIAEESTR